MINKVKFTRTLNFKVVFFTTMMLAAGIVLFFIFSAIGNYHVNHYYLSERSMSSRRAAVYNEFREYVQSNQLTSRDDVKFEQWSDRHPYASVTVRINRQANIGMSNSYINNVSTQYSSNTQPSSGECSGTYYMRFLDGVFQITITETSHTRQYQIVTVLSVLLGAICVLIAMFAYTNKLSKRVSELARSAQQIGGGDLAHEVSVRGHDEIALLAGEMDDMRRAVVERIDSEHKAWQANSQLITALSHDLRTPMTALIGYLELLKNDEYADDEQRRRFINAANRKAMEMKDMTDELFRYFLAFNSFGMELKLEPYDAGILLDQLLGENIIELTQDGYNVRFIRVQEPCSIKVDVMNLKRIFDNLFSNIRKYAEPARPVAIIAELTDGKSLSICFSNTKRSMSAKTESTNIGLLSCTRIAERLGGSFKVTSDEEHFSAEVILPAYPPIEG